MVSITASVTGLNSVCGVSPPSVFNKTKTILLVCTKVFPVSLQQCSLFMDGYLAHSPYSYCDNRRHLITLV